MTAIAPEEHGLGFGRENKELPPPDDRDQKFLLSAVVEPPELMAAPPPDIRYWWPGGWWGDQGRYPHCVAYAWGHELEDGPFTSAPFTPGVGGTIDPVELYNAAQAIDEWPGTNYDGTSVRAGAEVLRKLGYIKEYRWAWDLETAVDAIRTKGPIVVGTWWYTDMFRPDARGRIRVGGRRAGGHAYVINGVNLRTGVARIKNSWGRAWGRRGHAYITLPDLERLIKEQGEVCMPTAGHVGGVPQPEAA